MIIVQSIGLFALLIATCDEVTRIRTHLEVSPLKRFPDTAKLSISCEKAKNEKGPETNRIDSHAD
jgi:hypothetical protein